jgi:hypothetical protein
MHAARYSIAREGVQSHRHVGDLSDTPSKLPIGCPNCRRCSA